MDLTVKTNTGETYTINDVASVEDSKTNKVNSGGGGKYELVQDDTINLGGQTLYHIKSLKDFNDVKKGELGGYVQSYSNLSQEGNAWVNDEALVLDNAKVLDNAQVFGNARVSDNASVYGGAHVYGNAEVFGDTRSHD